MERWLVIALAAMALAGCAPPLTDATPPWAGLERPPESLAVRTFERRIDLLRPLAYATVIDLGMDITSSDGLGATQSVTARGQEREVQVHLERLDAHVTRVRVVARNGAEPDRATAERVVEGIAGRL